MGKNIVDRRRFVHIAEEALGYLKASFRQVEDQHGWHHHLGSYQKVGVIATAQALLSFAYFDEDFDHYQAALDTLVEMQWGRQPGDEHDGGWSYVTNASEYPTTEPTAWALLALSTAREVQNGVIQRGVRWLLNNRSETSPEPRGWGSTRHCNPRTYSTALVLRCLAKCGYEDSVEFRDGLEYLRTTRLVGSDHPGWGPTAGAPVTYLHSAHALLALAEAGSKADTRAIEECSQWLLDAYAPTTHWSDPDLSGAQEEIELTIPRDTGYYHQRVVYTHCVDAWVPHALIRGGRVASEPVFAAIADLTRGELAEWQPPGMRRLSYFHMWALHDGLAVLDAFRSCFPSWPELRSVVLDGRSITTVSDSRLWGWLRWRTRRPRWEYFLGAIIVPILVGMIANLVCSMVEGEPR